MKVARKYKKKLGLKLKKKYYINKNVVFKYN